MKIHRIHRGYIHAGKALVDLLISSLSIQFAGYSGIDLCCNLIRPVQRRQNLAEHSLAVSFIVDIGGIKLIIPRIQKFIDKSTDIRKEDRFSESHCSENKFNIIHSVSFTASQPVH